MEPYLVDQIIQTALHEDFPYGDITSRTLIDPTWESEMAIVGREEGIVAGLPLAERIFHTLDSSIQWIPNKEDGEHIKAGETVAIVKGKSQKILKAERVALNFLQRLSGIATRTDQYVQTVREVSDTVRIFDTRKTTPGLRYLERYAVRVGGGFNHRFCLSDYILIKDNHLAILRQEGKSISDALKNIRSTVSHTVRVELEVDNLEQIKEGLDAKVDAFLLDNMSCDEMKQAVKMIDGRAYTEASGGIKLDSVREVAATNVDLISVGALTHSAISLDFGLDYLR